MLSAVQNDSLTDLREYLDKGYNPNVPVSGSYLLNEAVQKSDLGIVDLLLQYGADPLLKVKGEDTIELAVRGNKIGIL